MFCKIASAQHFGMDAFIVEVQVDVSHSIPTFNTVGLPDEAVREWKNRVFIAIKNSGYNIKEKKITVNLAPANIKKQGSNFDLPIAIGILSAYGIVKNPKVCEMVLVGECALDGRIQPVRGIIPIIECAKINGFKGVIIPKGNANEIIQYEGISILAVQSLSEVVDYFENPNVNMDSYKISSTGMAQISNTTDNDFKYIRGQSFAKRGLEIALSGWHNILFSGPPGSGKTMLARAALSVLPEMTSGELYEIAKIHSLMQIQGVAKNHLVRPFRSPHHTISDARLLGGGKNASPGEVSLAHHGILFLDEFPEFKRNAIEALRQPLEDKKITVNRTTMTCSYPCDFLLIAAANPCPCGYHGVANKECVCTDGQIAKYQHKLSGPVLDRIDIQVDVPPVNYREEVVSTEESSIEIQARIVTCWKLQKERYRGLGIGYNSELKQEELIKYCFMEQKTKELLNHYANQHGISARSYYRIIKIAKTIADMETAEWILEKHVLEALQYRKIGL